MSRRIGNYLTATGIVGLIGSLGLNFYLDRNLERPVMGPLAKELHAVERLIGEAHIQDVFTPETAATYRSLEEAYVQLKRNPETHAQEVEFAEAYAARTNKHGIAMALVVVPSSLLALCGLYVRGERSSEEKPSSQKTVATGKPL